MMKYANSIGYCIEGLLIPLTLSENAMKLNKRRDVTWISAIFIS